MSGPYAIDDPNSAKSDKQFFTKIDLFMRLSLWDFSESSSEETLLNDDWDFDHVGQNGWQLRVQ